MKNLAFIVVIVASLFLSVPVSAQEQRASDSVVVNKKDSGTALVVFLRPKRFTGSGLTPSIYLDGVQLARLDNGRYFSIRVSAGKHKIESSMKHAPLELTVTPDENVYLEMVILMGNWRGGGRLIPESREDAKKAIEKLKPLDAQWVVDKNVGFHTE